MTRDELLAALDQAAPTLGPSYELCREAVARDEPFEESPHPVPVEALATIYESRLETFLSEGKSVASAAEVVAALRSTQLPALRLGHVGTTASDWFFQLFLHPHRPGVHACLAIDQR